MNRGFLNGPYCPIYGCGAILVISLVGWIDNFIVLFFVAMIVTSVLEYFTSWLLEVLFHAKWWDYSDFKYNIKGRVSLVGAVIFGALSVVLIKILHPFIAGQTDSLSANALFATVFVLFTVLLVDIVYTLNKFTKFQNKLKELHGYIQNSISSSQGIVEKAISQIEDTNAYNQVKDQLKIFLAKTNNQERRILKAFPQFKSIQYNEVLNKIKEHVFSQNISDNSDNNSNRNRNRNRNK